MLGCPCSVCLTSGPAYAQTSTDLVPSTTRLVVALHWSRPGFAFGPGSRGSSFGLLLDALVEDVIVGSTKLTEWRAGRGNVEMFTFCEIQIESGPT